MELNLEVRCLNEDMDWVSPNSPDFSIASVYVGKPGSYQCLADFEHHGGAVDFAEYLSGEWGIPFYDRSEKC